MWDEFVQKIKCKKYEISFKISKQIKNIFGDNIIEKVIFFLILLFILRFYLF